MPPIVDTWDPTLPPDSESPTLGANRIRELKRALDDRFANMGAKYPNGTDAASGRLTCGEQGVTGVIDLVYEADGDLLLTLHDDTAAANASRVILGTGIGGARDYTFETENVEAALITATQNFLVKRRITIDPAAMTTFTTTPYTVVDDDYLVLAGVAAGAWTANLPQASLNIGRLLYIKMVTTAGPGTVAAFAGDLIYFSGTGATTVAMASNTNRALLLCATASLRWDILSLS